MWKIVFNMYLFYKLYLEKQLQKSRQARANKPYYAK